VATANYDRPATVLPMCPLTALPGGCPVSERLRKRLYLLTLQRELREIRRELRALGEGEMS
jgi:hypothetical protein